MKVPYMIRKLEAVAPGSGTRVMTYNVLAQCLVRRDQYPTSGNYLRWANRSKTFPKELDLYNPDILLLQEVDNDHKQFWRNLLEARGFHCTFFSNPAKKHGLAICYKSQQFSIVGQSQLYFDSIEVPGVPRQCETGNVALFVDLQVKLTGKKLSVGTGHLYWHPEASYERARQILCILNEASKHEGLIFGGDLNTESFDPAYVLATGNQYATNSQPAKIMHASVRARSFDKLGAVRIKDGVAPANEALPNQGQSSNPGLLSEGEVLRATDAIEQAYRTSTYVATSMYAHHSRLTGAESGEAGEPLWTNWTEVFKGTLDYIFCIHEKNSPSPTVPLKLLVVPTKQEIGPGGCPKLGGSPSDHICMMAEVRLPACM